MSLDASHTESIKLEKAYMEVCRCLGQRFGITGRCRTGKRTSFVTHIWRFGMMTQEGEKVLCMETGKVCYTEREAGIVMNKARKHCYEGHMKTHKERYANSKEIPRRKYWCKACGFYHVTHMSRFLGDERISYREEEFYKDYSRKGALA